MKNIIVFCLIFNVYVCIDKNIVSKCYGQNIESLVSNSLVMYLKNNTKDSIYVLTDYTLKPDLDINGKKIIIIKKITELDLNRSRRYGVVNIFPIEHENRGEIIKVHICFMSVKFIDPNRFETSYFSGSIFVFEKLGDIDTYVLSDVISTDH